MNNGQRTEILAPAGGMESLKAAVRCGADAVYFGGKTLNARRGAENFDDIETEDAVKYCRSRGVKAYITLNTVLSDNDFADAVKIIERACAIGADALILQDLGLAKLAKEIAPGMILHASTQMSVQTRAGLELLRELGFSRVVLPRELSKTEIKALVENTPLELEMFVHGALCMSVSGQCYMSAMLGSRSGNRGLCAGPCRLPFAAENGTGFDLSLKDLSLIEHLRALEALGIRSFKIEGRMKRPEYVGAAVTACRKALDGELSNELAQNLQAVFSRSGFTEGYYTGNRGRTMFGTRQKDDVTAAAPVLSTLARLFDSEKPLVPVDFTFTCVAGEPLSLAAGAMGKSVFESSEVVPQPAQNRPLTRETIEEQLQKCGGTQFFAKETEIDLDEGLNVPLAAINALRRKTLEALNSALEQPKPIKFSAPVTVLKEHLEKPVWIYARFSALSQIPSELYGIKRIFLPLDSSAGGLGKLTEKGFEAAVEIPRGIFGGSEKIITQLKQAKAAGVQAACAGTIDGMELAKREGFSVHAGLGSNIYNSYALAKLAQMGVSEATLSFELNLLQAAALKGTLTRGLIAYGRLPLMLTRNCPVANGASCQACGGQGKLTDRMGIVFPVVCESGCAEVLNSRPLYMADRLGEMKNMDFLTLYFTTETKEECAEVIKAYKDSKAPQGDFTRGLYYRGVE